VVQLHDGTVEAQSPGLGQGSSFVVRLPASSGLRLDQDLAPAHDAERTRTRVVVVEDNPDIRDLLVELLRESGHEVACAEDGPRGLEQLLSFVPQIAFVDIGLPGFDGFELARRARACGCTARLVAVTGYAEAEDKRRAKESGFNQHLTKPVQAAEIQRALVEARGPIGMSDSSVR
jgi:CheY-like chemotaxis protein